MILYVGFRGNVLKEKCTMNTAWLSRHKVQKPKGKKTIKPSKKLKLLNDIQREMVKTVVDIKADDIGRPWLKEIDPADYRFKEKLKDGMIIVWIYGMTYRVAFTPEPYFGIYERPTVAPSNRNRSPLRGTYIRD